MWIRKREEEIGSTNENLSLTFLVTLNGYWVSAYLPSRFMSTTLLFLFKIIPTLHEYYHYTTYDVFHYFFRQDTTTDISPKNSSLTLSYHLSICVKPPLWHVCWTCSTLKKILFHAPKYKKTRHFRRSDANIFLLNYRSASTATRELWYFVPLVKQLEIRGRGRSWVIYYKPPVSRKVSR